MSAALTIKFAERTAAAGMAACALCATHEAPGRGTKSIAGTVGAQEEGTLKAAGVMSTLARNATMVGPAVDVSKVKDKVCSNSVRAKSGALEKQTKGHSLKEDGTHPAKNNVGKKEASQDEILTGIHMHRMGKAMVL